MKVRATERGYFDQIREPGDEFEVPDDTKAATWFEPVDKPVEKSTDKTKGKPAAGKPGNDDLA